MQLNSGGLRLFGVARAWILPALIALFACRLLWSGLWIGGSVTLLGAGAASPFARATLRLVSSARRTMWVSRLATALLSAAGLTLAISQEDARDRQQAKDAAAAAVNEIETRHDSLLAEYERDKGRILANAQEALDRGDFKEANRVLFRFGLVTDPDFRRLFIRAREAVLRDEIAGGPGDDRLAAAYAELAKLNPSDAEAATLAREIGQKVAQARNAQAISQASLAKVQERLSTWDGSHPDVVAAIKAKMHDPGSFEHVSTRLMPNEGTSVAIITTYRGKNKLGAVVLGTYTATVDAAGHVTAGDN